MKQIIILILYLLCNTVALKAQSADIKQIEKGIKLQAMEGKYQKKSVDLNNDGRIDVVYTYQCGEPKCVEVYLNIEGTYKKVVSEPFGNSKLDETTSKKQLQLILYHCCGESPYESRRLFGFGKNAALVEENYVLTNDEYVEEKNAMLLPTVYLATPRFVSNTIDNYNVRYSPTIKETGKKGVDDFVFTCEEGTNIIAKLKQKSTIKVLAEKVETVRTWLFVEIEKSAIVGECNPVNFDFKDQKLRGWISGKFTENIAKK